MSHPVISLENVSKRFPGVLAMDSVSMEVRQHEVVGLIGENGAGKSTLLKILSGVYQPDEGVMKRSGEPIRLRTPRAAADAGIGMVHQEQSLIGTVSVAENILLGSEGTSVRAGIYRWSELNRRAQRQLDKIQSSIKPTDKTESLTFAQRQLVELAKALGVEERSANEPVIILDEPTSVLDGDDLETLFEQVERLRSIASVVFVSHRLDEVLRVSDRVYVMKDGQVVAERDPKTVHVDELYRLMVGRESSGGYYREDEQQAISESTPVVLEVNGLNRAGSFHDVNLKVHSGEVLGLTGVVGSGREDLCRSLFGAEPFDSGEIVLNGARVSFSSPPDAVDVGIGYVPAERRTEGVAMGLSVEQNMVLADPSTVSTAGVVVPSRRAALVSEWTDRLKIKTPTPHVDVANLSGGNQQKVVLAKWLSSPKLKVLILDHPTRGLDVGAKEDVFTFVREACAEGLAIILLADTLEETIALSHHVLVFRDGAITAGFPAGPGNKPTQIQLVEAMV